LEHQLLANIDTLESCSLLQSHFLLAFFIDFLLNTTSTAQLELFFSHQSKGCHVEKWYLYEKCLSDSGAQRLET